jgi:putative SOS response-associated peptidase YedK
MCGRYMITSPFEAMSRLFAAEPAEGLGPDAPRLNVSPTQSIPVVISTEERRFLVPMRWGFIPHWYKSPGDGPLLINARAETIAEKPAFRAAVRERRCLFPVDGFYEWSGEKGAKIPHVIRRPDGAPFALAGIWQDWSPNDGDTPPVATATIVTCAANDTLAAVHHRMPVVIDPADAALWLGEAGHGAARLMQPAAETALVVAPADAETGAVLARRGG